MQAIILAAGRGTRMGDLTRDTPKPLLSYRGKSLLHHKLDALPREIAEVIIVVGYLGDAIRAALGDSHAGRPIRYVEQKELLGTGHAIWSLKGLLTGRFMVLMGDDIYDKDDLARLAERDHALLAYRNETPRAGGKFILNGDGTLSDIVEDADGSMDSPLVYTGACVMSPKIFGYELAKIPGRNEYGLPQTIVVMAKDVPVDVFEAKSWIQITSPEDLK
ncbi:MAG: nucleotidyltransferase family protein [Candidatus Paceibacterota bacterium]|jgi:bifunctional UDP-N-acetylglucosamine pyrophosphorylase/glucosamine-1-phosphate N-acetyltransferase